MWRSVHAVPGSPAHLCSCCTLQVPLPEPERSVLHEDLSWEEIQVGGAARFGWRVRVVLGR